jgi:D-tagatose-bisphosphate aldolase class II non-catalytic subunit
VDDVFSRLKNFRQRRIPAGMPSVCSSHPLVIEAAVRLAGRRGESLFIEATANQVNQHGGYTGLVPSAFTTLVRDLCAANGVDPRLVVLGGDHLGPYPWRDRDESHAMAEAETMVRLYIRAGARKIHLDASMPLAGDAAPVLDPEIAAARAVRLCAAAEDESRRRPAADAQKPVYVIGTEVPVPGGEVAAAGAPPRPTRGADFRSTVDLHRKLFHQAGLDDAWTRVIAVVAQPGVEFDALTVHPYRREAAVDLVESLGDFPGLLFEGHSTDYQATAALRALVEDGFGILKVGPELTFTLREALFGLASIEEELGAGTSRLRATVLDAMKADPRYWKGYYHEDESLPFCLIYAYSDRMRYYWGKPQVAHAVQELFGNLERIRIPPQLVSQFLPHLEPMPDLAAGGPRDLLLAVIERLLQRYQSACRPDAEAVEG